MAASTTTDPMRDALDAIMDWEGTTEGKPEAPGGAAAPRSDVVNLATTAELENVVPPEAENPFATELAALQASNAELSKQIAEMPALPVTTPAPAAIPAPLPTYQPYTPPAPAPAAAYNPSIAGYGAGQGGYTYNAAMNMNPYSSTSSLSSPGYGAGHQGYTYDAYYASNPYKKK